MSSLYLQLNLCLALAWILCRLLPRFKTSFRSRKMLAQGLLLLSLLAPLVFAFIPESSLPTFTVPMMVKDIDADQAIMAPVRKVLQAQTARPGAEGVSNGKIKPSWWLWFWVALTGLVGMQIRGWLRLRRLLERGIVLHQIGRVRVAVVEGVEIPFSVLTWRWAHVVLPSSLLTNKADFRIALRHEIEHHRRKDTLWALMLEWLRCGFYLNPTIYAWKKTILQLQELACDEALISRMGIPAQAYGSCLLRVAETALESRFMYVGTTCMIPDSGSHSRSFLRRRITMFSQHGKSPARKLVGAIVGTCAGIALLGVAYSARATLHPHAQVNPGRTNYDPTIQEMATEALQRGLENSQASAGFAIVSDALSGKVLSAVNINNGFDSGLQGDWALSYSMSPASGIKSLILASALQHSAVTVDQVFDTENGTYQFGKMTLHDAEPIAKLSSAEVVVHSSNIGIIKIAQAMGSRGLEKMFQEFGIGSGESIGDFPSARAGVVPSAGNIEDASYVVLTALGSSNRTGLATTPLEMVQAYGAIANGGRLMRAIPMDGTTAPSLVRNVLSKETAAQMRKVLRQAVTEGTGQTIQESSVMLAGKTLTNILSDNRRVGGFIGFAPADNPKLVIYVVMLDTKLPHAAGSNTAAYVFRDIAEKAIPEWTKR